MTVVAYDIANDKRRNRIVKLLEQYGTRINFSVFECMLTRRQKSDLIMEISEMIDEKHDQVVFYAICVDCYTKTEYLPKKKQGKAIVVVT